MEEHGLVCMAGTATFYFFVSIGSYPGTSTEFALSLLVNRKIAVVPGIAYGESTDRFVRLSIGTESEARINQALAAIRQEIQINDLDRDWLAGQVSSMQSLIRFGSRRTDVSSRVRA